MNDPGRSIRSFLFQVQSPGRYLDGEWNVVKKDPAGVSFRLALCYPDVYEIGMSHLGLSVLYHQVNREDALWAERCFAPWPDMAAEMRRRGIPLFTLESKTPLKDLDLVGFSLQQELTYTNVLFMLDLAGIPLESAARGAEDPLVVAGGCGGYTPEPMAEAVDLFLLGDGEAALPPILRLFAEMKRRGAGRGDLLAAAAERFPFAYVPAFYRPRHDGAGRYLGLDPLRPGVPEKIRPARVEDLEKAFVPLAPVQPGIRCVHDRITLEIMRGCTRGCRFCQAGMIKRPLRVRSPETLLAQAEAIYEATGYDEISLLSLSSSDYPELHRLMELLNERFTPLRVGLSLPSLRIDEKLRSIPGLSAAVRKAGLTLAPEAATERLRRSMNKPITDQDLEAGVREAFRMGWRRVKLYFMIGLPGEGEEDLRAIPRLGRRISEIGRETHGRAAEVNVTVSTFVPKAHTPFQWCAMERPGAVRDKQRLILDRPLPRWIRFKFHDRGMSFVEGMLARGGREAFHAVAGAYRAGAMFDAWKDRFSLEIWEQAFRAAGMDPEAMLHRERDAEERFPWDHVIPGPSPAFLRKEYERALRRETTPYCEGIQCNLCGIDPNLCARLKHDRPRPAPPSLPSAP